MHTELPLCTESPDSHHPGDSADKLPAFHLSARGGGGRLLEKKKRLSKSVCVIELECETKITISGRKIFKRAEWKRKMRR